MAHSGHTLKVLVIDDSFILRERLCWCLGSIEGVNIAGKANSVPTGIEAFRSVQPDVVILDLQMPGGSGIEVLEVIKSERPATKVIIFTNYPLPQLQKKCEEVGAEWFLDKTHDLTKLRTLLKELVSAQAVNNSRQDAGKP
jgi:DNA-binding NarL/FixJ family response regulator